MATEDVTIRRAPRMWSFMMTGAIVGVIVSAIVTTGAPIDPSVGFYPTFGFFALFGFVIGLALGGLVGFVIDANTKSTRGVAEITQTKERTPKARKPKI
jgi:ABC-type nitrate/sulfonate/bicarbonate transport system permease component